jgi:hypothetical protein
LERINNTVMLIFSCTFPLLKPRLLWVIAFELNLRIKPRKRLVREKPEPLAVPDTINEVWSMDFMHDQLQYGRRFRLFNVIDDFNREG